MSSQGENAIEVQGVNKLFSLGFGIRKRRALNDMSFSVRRGEIYGFLGPNGAGKTTSIKVLTSLLRPDSGKALLFDDLPSSASSRQRVGFLPESPVFYDHLTGSEFLRFCGTLCGMKGETLRRRISELLQEVGLAHAGDLQIRRYSKGMTQRVGIAQALLHNPDLVILDEPMSGLDPVGRADVRNIILTLQKQGKTIFFSTHIIPDVEAICSRVGIVSRGKMVKEGTVSELLREGGTGMSELIAQGFPSEATPAFVTRGVDLGGRVSLSVANADVKAAVQAVFQAGGVLVSLAPKQASLEDLVVRLIERGED